jgi:hypothetical protein
LPSISRRAIACLTNNSHISPLAVSTEISAYFPEHTGYPTRLQSGSVRIDVTKPEGQEGIVHPVQCFFAIFQ